MIKLLKLKSNILLESLIDNDIGDLSELEQNEIYLSLLNLKPFELLIQYDLSTNTIDLLSIDNKYTIEEINDD